MNRTGENGRVPSRHERFFQGNDEYWYYTTREGVDIGPFDSMKEAAHGAEEFVSFICSVEPGFAHTLEHYRPTAA